MAMKRFIIERDIPGIGAMSLTELCGAARASNKALTEIGSGIQWQHSYVAGDKTFCVYLAETEEEIRKHSELSGFFLVFSYNVSDLRPAQGGIAPAATARG